MKFTWLLDCAFVIIPPLVVTLIANWIMRIPIDGDFWRADYLFFSIPSYILFSFGFLFLDFLFKRETLLVGIAGCHIAMIFFVIFTIHVHAEGLFYLFYYPVAFIGFIIGILIGISRQKKKDSKGVR